MSLRAGRVGVAPDQVDDFGKIKSDATSGYTKQEADVKFETQTHAASTYETKTEAATAHDDLASKKMSYADNGILGAKNFCDKKSGETLNGITFTVGSDGAVTVNGTATAVTTFDIPVTPIHAKCKVSGLPEGTASVSTFLVSLRDFNKNVVGDVLQNDYVLDAADAERTYYYRIRIASGFEANNLKFLPMIRLADDPDNTFRPFSMTNRALTEFKIKLTTDLLTASSFTDFKNRMFS